ncbi:MAG TPA: hypothetical protein VF594_00710 [Rubricoccaceae bacterium]|jgi:hypothetical protein
MPTAWISGLLLAAVLFASAPDRPTRAEPRAASGVAPLSSVRDSLTVYYARQDTARVERLYRRRARTREERLLCLYRLYPMTLDRAYLRDIPSETGVTSARELALIAAMWAYRASSGPAYRLPIDGRRSERILGRALERDPNDPYALLVRGQSLYYKPRAFGGDVVAAQRTFERLRTALARNTPPGLHPFEAEVWIWMCVRRQNASQGAALQRRLIARRPPPLFRQFLVDPP